LLNIFILTPHALGHKISFLLIERTDTAITIAN